MDHVWTPTVMHRVAGTLANAAGNPLQTGCMLHSILTIQGPEHHHALCQAARGSLCEGQAPSNSSVDQANNQPRECAVHPRCVNLDTCTT
eukprot:397580-Pelagomonas_calceolata.AAC.2